MAVVLALLAAVSYGISDFIGGIVSKGRSVWFVALAGNLAAAACVSVFAVTSHRPSADGLIAAAIGGIGGGIGVGYLYRGLSTARMGVVAPVSAIGTALLPVAAGIVFGERPSAVVLAGIVLGIGAIGLISRQKDADPDRPSGLVDGLVAGAGFGFQFVMLDRVPDGDGLWPITVAYLAAAVCVFVIAIVTGQGWWDRSPGAWKALIVGPFGAAALVLFLLAAERGMLSVVAVITSLYPASTVLLATVLLREPIQKAQAVGLALAAVAVSLVAVG